MSTLWKIAMGTAIIPGFFVALAFAAWITLYIRNGGPPPVQWTAPLEIMLPMHIAILLAAVSPIFAAVA